MDNKHYVRLVSVEEVPRIMKNVSISDANYSWDMYLKYWETKKFKAFDKWEMMMALSYMFNVGRIQGIREERKRKKRYLIPAQKNKVR